MQRQTDIGDALEELLNCAICFDTYTRPKMLPLCQHTYCYGCIISLSAGETRIRCPQCRLEGLLPSSGVAGLKDNLLLNNLLSLKLTSTPKCTDCRSVPGIVQCKHCDALVCYKCQSQHVQLSSELDASLKDFKAQYSSNANQTKLKEKRTHIQKSAEILKNEVAAVKHSFKDAVQSLLTRREAIQNFLDVLVLMYDDMLKSANGKQGNSAEEFLKVEVSTSTTVQAMKDVKSLLDQVKTAFQLAKSRNDQFQFVGDFSSLKIGQFGRVEYGQTVVVDGTGPKKEEPKKTPVVTNKPVTTKSETTAAVAKKPEPTIAHVGLAYAVAETLAPRDYYGLFGFYESESDDDLPVARVVQSPYSQNQLPSGVDYTAMNNSGRVRFTGLDRPRCSTYDPATKEVYVADSRQKCVYVFGQNGTKRVFCRNAGTTMDVALSFDSQFVYVLEMTSLRKYTRDGRFVRQATAFNNRDLRCASAVVCYRHFVFVLEHDLNCVIVYHAVDLAYVRHFGARYLEEPVGMAIHNGDIFVTNFISSCVIVFGFGGGFQQRFAGLDEDFDIHGIAVDANGKVCIGRRASGSVEVYSAQKQKWCVLFRIALSDPMGLFLTPEGRLLVCDAGNHRVVEY